MRPVRHRLESLLTLVATGVLGGCASIGAPVPPSLELPRPPADLRAARKGDKVYLLWAAPALTTDRQSVRRRGPTLICRSLEAAMSQCGAAVGQVQPQPGVPGGHGKQLIRYVDTLPRELQQQNPERLITYAVEALNDSGRGAGLSNQAQVPLAPTLPPPREFAARTTSHGVLLSWQCTAASSMDHFAYRLRIFRRLKDKPEPSQIAELNYSECARGPQPASAQNTYTPEFYDQSFEWEKTYDYRAAVLTVITKDDQPPVLVEGDDTPEIELFTRDIYPPSVPAGLQAVFSGPGQLPFIDLLWAPDTDADLAGYNVYRREDGGQLTKINEELVKSPAFRDAKVISGTTYFYAVSAVDLRGNESAKSEETSERVP
jgi:hypothetical protein